MLNKLEERVNNPTFIHLIYASLIYAVTAIGHYGIGMREAEIAGLEEELQKQGYTEQKMTTLKQAKKVSTHRIFETGMFGASSAVVAALSFMVFNSRTRDK